jgi:HJR/Mrr/RecB family endonuclease
MKWYVSKAKNTLVKSVYYIMEHTIFSHAILFEDWGEKKNVTVLMFLNGSADEEVSSR